jgi:hypothetical protein
MCTRSLLICLGAIVVLTTVSTAQPVLGTRELRWFDATNTSYIGLSGPTTGSNYTLLLPTAAPTANSNSLLIVNAASAPWTMIWQPTSTTPGDVLTITSSAAAWSQPFWFLEGNTFTGTPTATGLGVAPVATTRWIGTNTATDFRIGTNNVIRGILSGTTGILSLQNDIFVNSSGNGGNGVRVGRGAGTGTAPTLSTVVGDGSLSVNTIGASNTAVGYNALLSNTTGSFNSALGAGALASNTTGSNNTAMGVNTLNANVIGGGNTAIGSQALRFSTGTANTAIGAWSLQSATAADSNVAVGAEALMNLTTGRANVALGFAAGRATTTGSRNIFIGPMAGTAEEATASDHFHLGGMSNDGSIMNPLLFGRLDLGRLWVNPLSANPTIPGGMLHVTSGSTGVRPLVLRAASGQVADFMQAETNTGRVVFSINATGGLDFRPIPVVGGAQQTREFRLYDLDGDYIGFKAPNNIDAADARVWTLPGTYGAQGDFLTSNTAGVLQWLSGFIYPPFVYDNASNAGNTESPQTFILGSIPENPTNVALGLNQAANNTGIGFNVLKNLKTADDNTAVGHQALFTLTGTVGATVYGSSGGSRNVAIGKDAMYSADGATALQTNENVAVGTSAMYMLTSGSRNVGIGYEALYSNTTASGNVAVGYRTLRSLTTGVSNVAVGDSALVNLTSGSRNTAVGTGALMSATTAVDNIAVGLDPLQFNTTGYSNVAIGNASMIRNVTGKENVAIGNTSLSRVQTGSNNVAIGFEAGGRLETSSNSNVAIGYRALRGGPSAFVSTVTSYNTAIGFEALLNMSNATGNQYNVAIGSNALRGTAGGTFQGQRNVAIGHSTLENVVNASSNVAIGYLSLQSLSTGPNNVAIGASSLNLGSTASNNVAIGSESMAGTTGFFTTSSNNTAIGYRALRANLTGSSNTAIGSSALAANTTGVSNVALGSSALLSATTAGSSIAIGANALSTTQLASNNVAVGTNSMQGSTSFRLGDAAFGFGTGNVGIGHQTLASIRFTSMSNTAIGSNALGAMLQSSGNTAVGAGALRNYTERPTLAESNTRNTAIGDSAMALLTVGINNVAVGTRALHNSLAASNNTAVGDSALFFQTAGTSNVAIGRSAMLGASGFPLTGSNNVAIGNLAMRDIRTTANSNTAVGVSAMQSLTTGNSNVALGASAGFNNQTNNGRLYIGNAAATALIHGDFSTGRVMINATGMTTSALSAPTINAALDIRTLVAGDRGLVIRTAAAATANAFEVQDNLGAVRFAISPSGNLSAINGVSYTWPTAAPAAAAVGQLGSGIMEVTNTGAMQWRQFVVVTANNLDFPNTDGQAVSDLDVAVVGAQIGDVVQLGTPVPLANTMYTAWVQADDLVRIRLHNYAAAGNFADPAAANFKITVMK